MAKLAFCGLGLMGTPMALRLLDAGHDLVVWNRTVEKTKPVADAGAVVAESAGEAAAGAEATITMLATPEALEAVVFGDDGIAAGIAAGSTLIEMSTVGPAVVADIAGRLPDGVEVIDAPVLGSTPQAEAGELQVFVGGPKDVYDRFEDVLRAFGEPRHLGERGSGAAMKLVVNSVLGAVLNCFGEAMALGDAHGLEPDAVLDVLEMSPIGGQVAKKRDKVVSGDYEPNFRLALAAKDMRLVVDAADRHGLDLGAARAARAAFEAAVESGYGDADYSAVVAHLRAAASS